MSRAVRPPGWRERRRRRGLPFPERFGGAALVTGASSGIGQAAAEKVAAAGAKVLLVARSADKLEVIKEEIEAAGGEAYVHPCDLADVDALLVAIVEDGVPALGELVEGRLDEPGRTLREGIDEGPGERPGEGRMGVEPEAARGGQRLLHLIDNTGILGDRRDQLLWSATCNQ